MRPTLLRQTRQAAGGLTAALSRHQPIRNSVARESIRVAAFHASSRRSLLPAGPRTFRSSSALIIVLLFFSLSLSLFYERRHSIILSALRKRKKKQVANQYVFQRLSRAPVCTIFDFLHDGRFGRIPTAIYLLFITSRDDIETVRRRNGMDL